METGEYYSEAHCASEYYSRGERALPMRKGYYPGHAFEGALGVHADLIRWKGNIPAMAHCARWEGLVA